MQGYDQYTELAYSHLNAAEVLLREGLYELSVFHLHQALELLIKAILIKRGYKPLKTHALHLLAKSLSIELTQRELDFLRELTLHYYASRYPDARARYGISRDYYNKERVEGLLRNVKKFFSRLRRADCKVDLGSLENGRNAYRELIRWVQGLEGKGIKVRFVGVIGSRAKGSWKPWSDIDVILIAENLPPRGIERYRLLLSDSIDLDIRAYTPEEAKEAVDKLEREFLDLERYGRIVKDDGIYDEIRERLYKVRRRYEVKYIDELDTWLVKPKSTANKRV